MRSTFLILGLCLAAPMLAQPDSWHRLNDIGLGAMNGPGPRSSAFSFTIGTKFYVGCGDNGSDSEFNDFHVFDPATDTWSSRASFPVPIKDAVAFSIGGMGYVLGGVSGPNAEPTNWVFRYNPATDQWQWWDALPFVRRYAIGFAIGTKGYIGLGEEIDVGLQNDWWEFDPALMSWTPRAPFPGGARQYAGGFVVSGKGYVGCGMNNVGELTQYHDLWQYDPVANAWAQRPALPGNGRTNPVGFAVGGSGYMGMGDAGAADLWEYSPAANTWSPKAPFIGDSRTRPTVAVVGQMAYVITGMHDVQALSDGYRFDPGANTWSRIAPLGGAPRSDACSFVVGQKLYVTCGFDRGWLKDLREFDPATGTWTRKADLPGARRMNAVAWGIGSKGYVLTGNNGGYLNDLWEYDPATDQWTQKASLPGAARDQATGFSINGKGYIACGSTTGGLFLNDLWEYDPGTDLWAQRASLPATARIRATAFTLNGIGHVTTGYGSSTYLSDTWAYDPANNTWTSRAAFPGGGRAWASSFSLSGQGYVGTGYSGSVNKRDMWRYDPGTNAWAAVAPFADVNSIRQRAVAAAIGGKAYMGTGINPGYYNEKQDFFYYEAGTAQVALTAKVLLEGPYDQTSALMGDQLRTLNLLPLLEPYTALGYAQAGGGGDVISVASPTGPDALVDWVLLELRTAPTAGSVVASRNCILQRDGDVVAGNGSTTVAFSNIPPGNYYVSVRHRNHLGVMTAAPVGLSATPVPVDLTSTATATYGSSARKAVGPKMVLWAGDATGNGQLRYTGSGNDRDPILLAVGSTTPNNTLQYQYDRRDTDLNGNIKYTGTANDRDIILTNVGSTTPNNTRTQQLP